MARCGVRLASLAPWNHPNQSYLEVLPGPGIKNVGFPRVLDRPAKEKDPWLRSLRLRSTYTGPLFPEFDSESNVSLKVVNPEGQICLFNRMSDLAS